MNRRPQATCSLCLVQFAKYNCPRCNVQYCSITCYKSEKHAQCSEAFYRDCFMTELQSQRISPGEKSKMIEILRRAGEESVEDEDGLEEDDESECLEDRLAGVNLDAEAPDKLWERLTKGEQEQFLQSVSSGHISSLLPLHTPWWRKEMNPVVVIEETTGANPNHVPQMLPNLPPLHTLVKDGKASPLVKYSVLNVLYAYVFTVRLYNGGHHELASEASQTVFDVSSCLSDNSMYSMAGEALTHAFTSVQQNKELACDGQMAISMIDDVSSILCGPPPLSRSTAPQALSDLHRLFSSAAAQIIAAEKGSKKAKTVKMACKKLYFLTVWAGENVDDLKCLARIVDIECETRKREWAEAQKTQIKLPITPRKKPLISEVS